MKWALACGLLVCVAWSAPSSVVTIDDANEMVGMSKLEAKIIATTRLGLFELKFTKADIRDFFVLGNPFEKYEEDKENVVLMDEFPYVPVVALPQRNTTLLLSSLVLDERLNPDLVQVEFINDYQSFRIVDMALNASFEWRVNQTATRGRAHVTVPQAWIHQNVEIACSHEQPSILVWEGRIDLYTTDIDIVTTTTDKQLIDEIALSLHNDPIVRKYIGNALQHQLALAIGKAHWKLQERMREDCLQCHGMRYSKDMIEVLIKGEPKCIAGLPQYMIEPLSDEATNPEDLARIAPESFKRSIQQARAAMAHKADDRLELQGLAGMESGKIQKIEALRPRYDWRDRFRHKHRPGFLEDPEAQHPWLKKLGQLWLRMRGIDPENVAPIANATVAPASNFTNVASPPSADGHDKLRALLGR